MKSFRSIIILFVACFFVAACEEQKEHTAPAILDRDSVPMMLSYGVNTMISDSGVMRYRIIAERWEVNEKVNPPRWIFRRGMFMEQFDEKFHSEAYIQCDTAYYYNTKKLWHLVGNVRMRTIDGLRFSSEELYWDQEQHELYSNCFSHLITPERELQGSYFTSDENMKHYTVTNTKGSFTREDATGKDDGKAGKDSKDKEKQDSVATPKRSPAQPRNK